MSYRVLGRIGIDVSEIGFGGWGIGGCLAVACVDTSVHSAA